MEISRISPTAVLLKTKTGKLTVDVSGQVMVEGGGESVTLSGPGEYEAFGFSLIGLAAGWLVEAEEIRIGVLPDGKIIVPAATSDDLAAAASLEPRREKKLLLSKLSLPEETELVILEAQ